MNARIVVNHGWRVVAAVPSTKNPDDRAYDRHYELRHDGHDGQVWTDELGRRVDGPPELVRALDEAWEREKV